MKQRKVVVLVDSGNTHNFLSQLVVEELSLPIDKSIPPRVGVASGMKLLSVGILSWSHKCRATVFHVNPLNDYDIVLVAQWAKESGPVWWDFKSKLLSFKHQQKDITRQGLFTQDIKKRIKEDLAAGCSIGSAAIS